jgi:antitoxin component YwqK of YwqJK toxin-antitoxin module
MKKILFLLSFLMFQSLYSQTTEFTDNNGDGVIEYRLVSTNGTLLEEGYYFNNKMVGTWRLYTNSGDLQMVAQFRNGLKHGKWLIYDEKGRVKTEIVYVQNRKESATEHRYTN